MRTSLVIFFFELIAQRPAAERTASRLLDGRGPLPVDRVFRELPALLAPGDLLVFNDTRVIKARLYGTKASGGAVEVLVERVLPDGAEVLAHVRASKSPRPGTVLQLAGAFDAEVLGREGPDDALFTVATDGAALYPSELPRIPERLFRGRVTPASAEAALARHLDGASTEHVRELTHEERLRIFHLRYFTWVEGAWWRFNGDAGANSGKSHPQCPTGMGRYLGSIPTNASPLGGYSGSWWIREYPASGAVWMSYFHSTFEQQVLLYFSPNGSGSTTGVPRWAHAVAYADAGSPPAHPCHGRNYTAPLHSTGSNDLCLLATEGYAPDGADRPAGRCDFLTQQHWRGTVARWYDSPTSGRFNITNPDAVLVIIHGFTGETKAFLQPERKKPVNPLLLDIQQHYDLVLAFDYDSYSTGIRQTALDFKKRLTDVGLGGGHGKTLHIMAHSMGGLVSRWMIEKEGASDMVQHLTMLGTPNNGSPWPKMKDWAAWAVTIGLSKITLVGWPSLALNYLMEGTEKATSLDKVTDDMNPDRS